MRVAQLRADEAEKTILSTALNNPECIPQIAELLEPEHFYSNKNQKLFAAIIELFQNGAPVDAAALVPKLTPGHTENGMGAYLSRVLDEPVSHDISYHAGLILRAETLRRVRAEAIRLKEFAEKENDPAKILNSAAKAFSSIQRTVEAIPSKGRPKCFTACDLMKTAFPEPKWAIPGLLVDGFSFLIGRPKQGKSLLALHTGLSVAYGGKAIGSIDVEPGQAIYLALEDPWRRLKSRMCQMLDAADPPQDLILFNEWPRIDAGGLEQLEREMKKHDRLRLVIIDTFQKIKGENRLKHSVYEHDYAQVAALKSLADKAGVAMLVIHHLRKAQAEDIFDQVSGSLGLTGAADSTLILDRKTGQADAVLHVTGRDVESAEYALRFDPRYLSWNLLGEASEIQSTEQQQAVYDALKTFDNPISPKQLQEVTDLKYRNVMKILHKLVSEGAVQQVGRGRYVIQTQ